MHLGLKCNDCNQKRLVKSKHNPNYYVIGGCHIYDFVFILHGNHIYLEASQVPTDIYKELAPELSEANVDSYYRQGYRIGVTWDNPNDPVGPGACNCGECEAVVAQNRIKWFKGFNAGQTHLNYIRKMG